MKSNNISKERKKYIKKIKLNKFLVISTQILILVRNFNNLGSNGKCKCN